MGYVMEPAPGTDPEQGHDDGIRTKHDPHIFFDRLHDRASLPSDHLHLGTGERWQMAMALMEPAPGTDPESPPYQSGSLPLR